MTGVLELDLTWVDLTDRAPEFPILPWLCTLRAEAEEVRGEVGIVIPESRRCIRITPETQFSRPRNTFTSCRPQAVTELPVPPSIVSPPTKETLRAAFVKSAVRALNKATFI